MWFCVQVVFVNANDSPVSHPTEKAYLPAKRSRAPALAVDSFSGRNTLRANKVLTPAKISDAFLARARKRGMMMA